MLVLNFEKIRTWVDTMSGKIIIQYEIESRSYRAVWDESVNVKYIIRVLQFRNAQNIRVRFI